MKHSSLVTFAFSVGTTATTYLDAQKVSYTGYEVVRVPVGDNVSKVLEIIENLGLETWQEPHEARAFADIIVPPEKL